MIIATDWDRFTGFCNDPAQVDGWAAWLRVRTARRAFFTVHLGKRPHQWLPRLGVYRAYL